MKKSLIGLPCSITGVIIYIRNSDSEKKQIIVYQEKRAWYDYQHHWSDYGFMDILVLEQLIIPQII